LAVVTTLLVGGLILIIWLSAPRLSSEIGDLSQRLPHAFETLRARLDTHPIGHLLVQAITTIKSGMPAPDGNILIILNRGINFLVGVLVIFFTGLFLAIQPRMYVRGVLHLFPPARRSRAADILGAVGYTLKWWMIGQSVDMVVIGVATAVGLWLLHVPLALVIGLLAALFNFIPNFGPLFSLVPALLLTLPDDPTKALYVLILFIVLQNLEGYVLMPLIQGKASSLPGAITIIAQVLMGLLAGGLGLALAAPLAAATFLAVKMTYVEDVLGDRIETPADHPAAEEVVEARHAAAEVSQERKAPPRTDRH
jgi:predicted PurR-regulated permease PerM